jgi:hypothetical protein
MAAASHGNTPSVSSTNRYHTGQGVLHVALESRLPARKKAILTGLHAI